MESILVTGCAGFIGSHTCEALLERGETVVGVDDFNDYYDSNIKRKNAEVLSKYSNFTLYDVDIRDKDRMQQIFDEHSIGRVIHLGARAGVRASLKEPELYYEVNVTATKHLLELAHKAKVRHFVFASSSSVYGEAKKVPFSEDDELAPISPYAETKKEMEEACKAFHDQTEMPITGLRFFTVYGPRGRPDMAICLFTDAMFKGKPIKRFGDGTSKRDYTYVKDIVAGILAALDNPKGYEIYNLGNNKPVELSRLINVIEEATGKKAIIEQLPDQPGDVPITYADISKAKRMLGWEPTTSIEEGVQKFVEWYRQSN